MPIQMVALPLPLAGEVASHREMGCGLGKFPPLEQFESWIHPHPSPRSQAGEGVLCQEDARASCYVRDEGKALRSRPVGGGFKPPRAASAKTRGGERLG